MDYKNKPEVLEWARKHWELVFPDLAESERIRKSLLAYIKGESKYLDTKKWIEWIEKQKESTTIKVESKEGNEQKSLTTEETELNSIAFLEQLGYTCIPQSEQKPANRSEEDELINEHELKVLKLVAEKDGTCLMGLYNKLKSLHSRQKASNNWKPSEKQMKDEQVIVITEPHCEANIEWDCRSLNDVIALLKCAELFITEKQIEKMAGPGSSPDYATTEGRYSHLFKCYQEQPEVDLEKEIKRFLREDYDRVTVGDVARHFYELGLNARRNRYDYMQHV